MAETKTDGKPAAVDESGAAIPPVQVPAVSTDDVRRLSSQPQGLPPQGDVVAMVTRDVDGNPRQSKNFTVLVPEGASDAERDAHWNRAGEAQGAKHLSGGGREETPTYGAGDGFTDEERAARAETERRELHRHNFREELKP